MTDDQREAWEERAAIMEYDGGLTREVAERMARDIVFGGNAPARHGDGAGERAGCSDKPR